MTTISPAATELARAAAAAGAAVLPAAEPLTVGTAAPGDAQVTGPFAGAVVADLEAPVPGQVAVLVGQELVDALASSPLGGLDLAAALQPTLDAVAASLGGRAAAARQVDVDLVVREVASPFTVVLLHATSSAAAILVPDLVLSAAQDSGLSATEPALEPLAAPPTAAAITGTVLNGLSASNVEQLDHHRHGIELLHGVDMEVTVEIGRTRMTVRDLLELTPGAVLELDRAAGSPADLLVNGRLIARGEVVVIDEDFGLRITEIAIDAAAG
ncbi:flagellar motor switch protein FliN [Nocardioides sp. CN2-186]|uniref:flagellar motor switch protein FliN n=1 Tax=Nocardioides tweenelious TaxID=3156607 RepID=UPI0032B4CA55